MIKKILILGGTQMISRSFVELLLENRIEYSITIANRGITNNSLFPNIRRICLDRNQDCSVLNNEYFDIVIDFSCYTDHQLFNILKHIHYNHYIIVSTLGILDNILENPEHPWYEYIKNKYDLENYILSNHLQNFTIVRPCILFGKNDYTDRFYEKDQKIYWKHNDEMVQESKHLLSVDNFSKLLYNYIFIDKQLLALDTIIHINGEGLSIQNKPLKINSGKTKYNIHPYESKYINIQKFTSPFNYIIIDNLFNSYIYNQLCDKFPSFIARTKPYKDQPGATSNYEGYISGLSMPDMVGGYDFFSSDELKLFVAQSFKIKLLQYISPSAHFHRAPSKSGFIHRDMNICSFPRSDDRVVTPSSGTMYTDDSIDNLNSVKVMRSIALLYYLNNNNDSLDSVGGGTGIYDSQGKLLTTIEPKNNRLFIFEISHNSYHAFIGANYDRSAIVSWFHSSPAYIVHRYLEEFNNNPNLIEKWTQRPIDKYWKIENDPEYSLYFKE